MAKKNLDVFVSLSYKSILVAYKEKNELKIEEFLFEIQTDIDTLLQNWSNGIDKLFSKVKFKPNLILLVNDASFWVKNLRDISDDKERYEYVSSQIDIEKGYFEMTEVKKGSFLVVPNSTVEKIIFTFRKYIIKSLNDFSILNAFYLLKDKNELYLNISLNSTDAIINSNIFQKRSLKNLFLNYLIKSSKKLNLDLDSTFRHIQKNFTDISSYTELVNSTHNGAYDLKEFIDELVNFIESTLIYFNNYDELKDIETIYLDGDILELDFIVMMLKERLNFDGLVKVDDFLSLSDSKKSVVVIASESENKYFEQSLIPLNGLEYSDGKQKYIFVDSGLISQKKLTKAQKKRLVTFNRVIEIEERRRKVSSNISNKSIWQMDGSELLTLIKSKFSPSEVKNIAQSDEVDEERGKKILLVGLALLFGGYELYLYIDSLESKFRSTIYSYESNVNSVSEKQEKLSGVGHLFIESGVDKILWTEKFITLAENMPDAIWFSSIRLENFDKEIEGKKVTSSRMILDGRCLPSSKGHIDTIATYMDKLMNSDKNFRKDFIDVSFGGAESVFDEFNRNLISFKLYLNFRRNIHVEDIKKEIKVEDRSLAENLSSIKKNSDNKIKKLDNIGKE